MKNKNAKQMKVNLVVVWLGLLLGSQVHAELSQSDVLKYIDVSFCNSQPWSPSLNLDMSEQNQNQICFDLINKSEDFANIKVDFVDAVLKEWGDWIPTCLDDLSPRTWLSKFITMDAQPIEVKAKETARRMASITQTDSLHGANYACLTIRQANPVIGSWTVNVVMRSIFKIKATYSWTSLVDLKSQAEFTIPAWTKLIKKEWPVNVYKDINSNYFVEIPFKNDWTEEISASASLHVKWTWNYDFSRDDNVNVSSKSQSSIKYALPKITWFWGSYNFDVKLKKSVIKKVWLANTNPVEEAYNFSVIILNYNLIFWVLWWLIVLLVILRLIKNRKNSK